MDYGIPAEADTQVEQKPAKVSPEGIEKTVNELVTKMKKVGDKEKLNEILSQYDPAIVVAARAEKRRRDTQAAYTKTQQEKLAIEAENKKLEELIAEELEKSLTLTTEQKEELEELKLVDPDEWRAKLNELEKEQKTLKKKKLKELTEEARQEALQQAELQRRAQILEEFQAKHPDVKIDDEVISNDIPPRFVKELENGKISFEEFLQKAYDFLKSGKVVAQPKVDDKPDLSKVSGGTNPMEASSPGDIFELYNKETF